MTNPESWTPERRAQQSERMKQTRPIDSRGNPAPKSKRGEHRHVLSDEDLSLVMGLLDERNRLIALRSAIKTAYEAETAALTQRIRAISNAAIADKFDVPEATIRNASHSCRGNLI